MLCTIGVFYAGYRENIFERVGASFLAIWCFARIDYKFTTDTPTEPVHLFLHIGLALFFGGLAYSMKSGPISFRLSYFKRLFQHHI